MDPLVAIGIIAALNGLWLLVSDRKDKRHVQSLDRLAQRVSAPMTVLDQAPSGTVPEPQYRNEFTEEQEHLEELEPHMLAPFMGGD
jgi:hypothetical protein